MQSTILAAVKVFTRGAGQADDIALLLLRYQGAAQAVTALADSPINFGHDRR